jgi:aldehyde dehydrogenase (NAD+)/betaine-aldehyde dehydrogenase
MSWTPASGWETRLHIGGAFVEGEGAAMAVENPTTEAIITEVREASPSQIDDAVAAARRAFDSGIWRDGAQRRSVLLAIAELLDKERAELSGAMISDLGSPRALMDPLHIGITQQLLRFYAGQAVRDLTRDLGPDGNAAMPCASMVRYEPVGVVAAIAAYNYPLLIMALKIAPALAAGCTVIVLPSPQAPLATLMFARLLERAGVPAGVVNIVAGGAEIGRYLTEHPGIDKVSFTGSVHVGREIMRQAATGIKGVVLELGGKSAAIMLPDGDMAPQLACHLRYLRNAGQGCASPTRILVHESKFDEFLARSREFISAVKVGDPWEADTALGPVISKAHRERVEGYVQRAVAAGAEIVVGGGRPDFAKGWFIQPTLLARLDNGFEIAREELFGPVGVALPYRDIEEAIAIANDSTLGLASYIFGPLDQARAIAPRIRAGSVYINGGGLTRMDAPMGGFKQSGLGREYGPEGMMEYLEPQHIQWTLG